MYSSMGFLLMVIDPRPGLIQIRATEVFLLPTA
jgi:hypothetical protein